MRRSRIDIIIEILETAREGANKTRIVYRTNLNFKLAEKYLELLKNHDLIKTESDKYFTTEKGRIFITKAKEIMI